MNCDFCSVTSFNCGNYRTRPVEEVLDEIQAFHGDKRNIFFVDDNIGGITQAHRERAKELFRGIIDRKLKFNWFSQTSVDFADDEEAVRLAGKSGCRLLLVGFETESVEGLKSANKKTICARVLKIIIRSLKSFTKAELACWALSFSGWRLTRRKISPPGPGSSTV